MKENKAALRLEYICTADPQKKCKHYKKYSKDNTFCRYSQFQEDWPDEELCENKQAQAEALENYDWEKINIEKIQFAFDWERVKNVKRIMENKKQWVLLSG